MLKAIYKFFESIGRARAAAQLSSLGHYELAKKVMLDQTEEKTNLDVTEVHP